MNKVKNDEPYIGIRQEGKHTFIVSIDHGIMRYGPDGYGWFCWSKKSAIRKGRKELAKYLKKESYRREFRVES